ncbi:hypothetical protein Y032_0203g1856 [Ancylostoma ceylanicum]|uniref:Uncharacterized protein n=1 Tax=Ancylostoma ceylanicum TaxID=53326 RepID=A0A016SM75_9BILA|nr:hypothetical protein Y032_0203g1856 [Ancylostoma ceylanicum]
MSVCAVWTSTIDRGGASGQLPYALTGIDLLRLETLLQAHTFGSGDEPCRVGQLVLANWHSTAKNKDHMAKYTPNRSSSVLLECMRVP